MSKKVCEYLPEQGIENLLLLRKDNARSAALKLKDGKYCLISPIKNTHHQAAGIGAVSHILAPNHYHNKGLADFSKQFPGASICASSAARPRLEKITGNKLKPLTSLVRRFPSNVELLEPKGLKTGEIWLRLHTTDQCTWLVCDSFSGKKMTATSSSTRVPTLLGTFPSYGVDNSEIYSQWVLNQIEQDQPTKVIPCHGSIVEDLKLPGKLAKLMSTFN